MLQIYTGEGKGKTTAAFGLALRAAGQGMKVYICQFAKKGAYGEVRALKRFPNVTLEQFGRECFIKPNCTKEDNACARSGFLRLKKILASGSYDVVIADELLIALKLGLLALPEVLQVCAEAGKTTELILTGRYAPPELIRVADLVSEIKDKKHYFRQHGTKARKGIEF